MAVRARFCVYSLDLFPSPCKIYYIIFLFKSQQLETHISEFDGNFYFFRRFLTFFALTKDTIYERKAHALEHLHKR